MTTTKHPSLKASLLTAFREKGSTLFNGNEKRFDTPVAKSFWAGFTGTTCVGLSLIETAAYDSGMLASMLSD